LAKLPGRQAPGKPACGPARSAWQGRAAWA